MNTEILKELLREFGLDPADWELEVTRRVGEIFRCEIRSQLETLCFEGWADKESWISLTLLDS